MNVPAQLISGDHEQVVGHVQRMMRQQFCPTLKTQPDTDCFCNECRRIQNQQHPFIIWITPEKDYTVDDIEIIFDRIRFSLDPGQQFFFILNNAHTMTTATANRLLKVVEEPPPGYHFLFLTTNDEAILPTIASRCIALPLMAEKGSSPLLDQHPLLAYFYTPEKRSDPAGFEQELKKQHLSDTQSEELFDRMYTQFTLRLKTSIQQNNDQEQQELSAILNFLVAAQRKPPQSGSSDIFWKYIFLAFPR